MIPLIGFMIGTYIVFRFLEVFKFAPERYASTHAHVIAKFYAGIGMLIVGFLLLSLLMAAGILDVTSHQH